MWKHHTDRENTFQCDTQLSNCEMVLFNSEHSGLAFNVLPEKNFHKYVFWTSHHFGKLEGLSLDPNADHDI